MDSNPLVTVVIPAFNPGSFLREAIRSVEDQTYENWEAVIIDDGSTEDLSWVDDVSSRVRLIKQDNRGQPAARNAGITRAQGAFVAFLDADDVWAPRKLELQLGAWQVGASMSATTFYRFSGEDRFAGWAPNRGGHDDLLRGNGICVSSVVVDRELISGLGGFDERLRFAEDWDMWLRLLKVGHLVPLDAILTGYRVHPGQISGRPLRMWFWSVLVVLKQRGPFGSSAAGLHRVGEIYGSQLLDRFRARRNPLDLLAALLLSPRYIGGELLRYASRRQSRRPSPAPDQ